MKTGRNVFFGLVVGTMVFVSGVAFAETATSAPVVTLGQTTTVSQTAATSATIKTVTSKVNSVNGDGTKGVRSDITIVDDRGLNLNVVVKFGTPITDKDGKTVSFSDIKEGNKVTVEYITKSTGTNRAQSIKLVE